MVESKGQQEAWAIVEDILDDWRKGVIDTRECIISLQRAGVTWPASGHVNYPETIWKNKAHRSPPYVLLSRNVFEGRLANRFAEVTLARAARILLRPKDASAVSAKMRRQKDVARDADQSLKD